MRLRLLLLLAVPVGAVLVLAALVVVNRNDAYDTAKQATTVAQLAGMVAELDTALGDESMSGARLFVEQQAGDAVTYGSEQERVDRLLVALEVELAKDPRANQGLLSAIDVINETLKYRTDVDNGHITPLQIADRYAHLRSELIGALGRRATATSSQGGSTSLSQLVALIESRSVHIDERLAVKLGLRYGTWAVGHHSAVVQSIAVQEQLVGERSDLGLQSERLRVPAELAEMRERLVTEMEVPDYAELDWLAASDQWLAILDETVAAESARISTNFRNQERAASSDLNATVFAVGMVLLLALAIAGRVAVQLVRRIAAITAQAQRLASGLSPDETAPVVRGHDEIGQLASTFDAMNSRLASENRFREQELAVLEGIAQGDQLSVSLDRCARLLEFDDANEAPPRLHFTPTDPANGAVPVAESLQGTTRLWLLDRDGGAVVPPSGSRARSAIGLAALAQNRADADARLEDQASHDALTGLLNRRAILEKSDQHERTDGADKRTGFLFIDLDDFKQVNDSFGHHVGDQVLVHQAQRLTEVCDLLGGWAGRLGGDEFLVVVPQLRFGGDLAEIAETFAAVLAEPLAIRGVTVHCTASIGAVLARPNVAVEELRHEADTALYEAKDSGRGIAIVSTDELRQRVQKSEALRVAFRDGLANGELEPFFQPIWGDDGIRLTALEALTRWKRPGHGYISPGVFLPIAEELGLLGKLDAVLFRRVCEQVSAWRSSGLEVPCVHINASSVRIDDPDLVPSTLRILEETGCAPSQVVIEVTESGLMSNLESSSQSLQGLRDRGVKIAADDFGTGYSSLSYLKGLPVDILKIDRQFVDHIDESEPTQAIVRAIHTLARTLGMEVVAEGVERPEEMDYLTSIGCSQIQGFLLGRPAPAVETAALLAEADRVQPPSPTGFDSFFAASVPPVADLLAESAE